MRIVGETPAQRRRLEQIKAERGLTSDGALITRALVALTGGPPPALPLEGGAEAEDTGARVLADGVRVLWNSITTPPIPRSTRLTVQLRTKIGARLKVFKASVLEVVFREVEATSWCRGEGQRPWLIDLSWLMHSEDRVQKFLDLAQSRRQTGATTRPSTCRHVPPCRDQTSCTELLLREMR